jgi:hypothetical protein
MAKKHKENTPSASKKCRVSTTTAGEIDTLDVISKILDQKGIYHYSAINSVVVPNMGKEYLSLGIKNGFAQAPALVIKDDGNGLEFKITELRFYMKESENGDNAWKVIASIEAIRKSGDVLVEASHRRRPDSVYGIYAITLSTKSVLSCPKEIITADYFDEIIKDMLSKFEKTGIVIEGLIENRKLIPRGELDKEALAILDEYEKMSKE